MKIITWNLNGLTSCIENNSFKSIECLKPDIICCQETKTGNKPDVLQDYLHFWNPSSRSGYSGTLCMTGNIPDNVSNGIGAPSLDKEGRVITLEYPDFYVVNAYAPNSQKDLYRHQFRMDWDIAFRKYVSKLNYIKPVIACGDFNVARLDIDIYPENTRLYYDRLGYASDEASNLESLLECGFKDAFRLIYPDKISYTWWSNRLFKRNENKGWRLDYFIISECLADYVKDVVHHNEIYGSDHCPVELEISI